MSKTSRIFLKNTTTVRKIISATKTFGEIQNKCDCCRVCAGIAKYLKIDTALVRLFAVLSLLFWCVVAAAYFIAAFVMPREYVFSELTNDEKKIQKKENYKTVTGSLLMFAGMYLLLDSLGFILFRIPFLPSGRFLFPFVSVVAGAYFISLKEGKLNVLKELFLDNFSRSRSDRYLMGFAEVLQNILMRNLRR
jgi:phage shock protein PspC (stress-responsive transcriptional regulator)